MKNAIYNGECVEVMQKYLKNNSVDLIVSDPPFGTDFKTDLYDDSLDTVASQIPGWYQEWYRVLKKDSYLYVFVGVKTLHIWIQKGIEAGFTFKNVLATRSFNNNSFVPKNNFGFQFQPILVFAKGKGKDFNNVDFIPTSEDWFNDKRNTNPKPYVYDYPNWIKTEWCFANTKRSSDNLHPNEKNVDLIKFLIEISTKENEVVLDSFMGCGSTGVASMLSNRCFIGIEIDKDYCEFSKKRLHKYINLFNFEKVETE